MQQALALVPLDADVVTVTDWDAIRARLGVPDLTSEDLMSDRTAFWEQARQEAVLLTDGLLLEDNSELMLDHGFTQDDVDWEARWSGPDGAGYALRFRDDLDLAAVQAAIDAEVGELAGATVRADEHLVVEGPPTRRRGRPTRRWPTSPGRRQRRRTSTAAASRSTRRSVPTRPSRTWTPCSPSTTSATWTRWRRSR